MGKIFFGYITCISAKRTDLFCPTARYVIPKLCHAPVKGRASLLYKMFNTD